MDRLQGRKLIKVAQCVQCSSVSWSLTAGELCSLLEKCSYNLEGIRTFLCSGFSQKRWGTNLDANERWTLFWKNSMQPGKILLSWWDKNQDGQVAKVPKDSSKRAEQWFNFTFFNYNKLAQREKSGYFNYELHSPLQLCTQCTMELLQCKYVANECKTCVEWQPLAS